MKVALVHDYLNEFGGAERVLMALTQIWPKAPIYTAFVRPGSAAAKHFKGKKIISSWAQWIPGFSRYLYSPLRFLAPGIWGSFKKNLQKYDAVISSSSWYVTKGFGVPLEICYCHTPPRWLYGYQTSIEWQKYWPVKIYGQIVGHFMRQHDFYSAQKVNYFIANSEEVKKRIKKFYRREAKVIYPPVSLPKAKTPKRKGNYYLTVSRLVGGKGLSLAVKAAKKYGFNLKVVGEAAGYGQESKRLTSAASKQVEFLGRVSDKKLSRLYVHAKALLAVSYDEDFGITPLESMACGTPVVAFKGGGYKETVVEGKTGVFFNTYSPEGLYQAITKLNKMHINPANCIKQSQKFSLERFKREMRQFVEAKAT